MLAEVHRASAARATDLERTARIDVLAGLAQVVDEVAGKSVIVQVQPIWLTAQRRDENLERQIDDGDRDIGTHRDLGLVETSGQRGFVGAACPRCQAQPSRVLGLQRTPSLSKVISLNGDSTTAGGASSCHRAWYRHHRQSLGSSGGSA